MGADGHISIWRKNKVIEKFPDAEKLFNCLPSTYVDILNGVEYYHSYYGDNIYTRYFNESDWYIDADVTKERLTEFVQWLESAESEKVEWEVWT